MDSTHPRWPLLVLLGLVAAFANFWLWPDSGLLFGLPVNLAYHLALCAAASALLWVVSRWGWPGNGDSPEK